MNRYEIWAAVAIVSIAIVLNGAMGRYQSTTGPGHYVIVTDRLMGTAQICETSEFDPENWKPICKGSKRVAP